MWKKWAAVAAVAAVGLAVAEADRRPLFMYLQGDMADWSNPCAEILWMTEHGVSHVLLAYLVNGEARDALDAFEKLTIEKRKECIEAVHANGSKLLLASGGPTEVPYLSDAVAYGKNAATAALGLGLDGLSFDFEELPPHFSDTIFRKWIVDATTAARESLSGSGRSEMIILHSPQAPYLTAWGGSDQGYVGIAKELGDIVDYYTVQYYNQQDCSYSDYDSLFLLTPGHCWAPGASLKELEVSLGSDLVKKIIIGKPATDRDLYNTGFVPPSTLIGIVCKGEEERDYRNGIMAWSFRGMNDPHMRDFFAHMAGPRCTSDSAVTVRKEAVSGAKRPLFMYVNANVSWNGSMCEDIMWNIDNGATHVLLAFLLNKAPFDAVVAWEQLGDSGMKDCVNRVHLAGGKVFLATGGADEIPYMTFDPEDYGRNAAEHALRLHLDGVDFDLEHLPAGFGGQPHYMNWLRRSSEVCREVLNASGRSGLEITHAPQTPYFSAWGYDGYVTLAQELGDVVDFYLIQYYNQESCTYEGYESMFVRSGQCHGADEAIPELQKKIGQYGHKLVVGKPALHDDVYNTGYVPAAQMAEFICKAERETGYNTGIMGWSYRGKDRPDMQEYYDMLGGNMCGEGSPTDPPQGPTDPTTKATTQAPGTDPTTKATTQAPVTDPTTNKPTAPPPSGGAACYVANVWWIADCHSPELCQLDTSLTTESACVNSGKKNPVWAASEAECRTSIAGRGCL